MIHYVIEGTPRPQGSKRHVGGGVMIESSKHVKEWRAFARLKAVEAMQGKELIARPSCVQLSVSFVFARPKKHYTPKGLLRQDAPCNHTSRPDADKLLRALFDSMSEVVFEDDSQVARVEVFKSYAEGTFTEVRVQKVAG